MLLRPAVETDIPALQAILRNSWLTVWAPELKFETVQRFAASDPAGAYARDSWRKFTVAENDGGLLGLFHVGENHLYALHLDPKHKRRGIGTAMMDEIERRIAAHHPFATLEVRAFNTAAIAFYAQRGWTRQRSYMSAECGEPVLTYEMTKPL